jgi:hypothetical protein
LPLLLPAVLSFGLASQSLALTQAELNLQRALWNSKNISSYDFTLDVSCFCGPIVTPALVSVRSGVITSVKDPVTMAVVDPAFHDVYRTVNGLFDFLQQGVNFPAHTLEATFDPQLGYPTQIVYDFVLLVADDEGSFRARNLVAIPEPGSAALALFAIAIIGAARRRSRAAE